MRDILDMAHNMAKDLHAVGTMDTIPMRMMDELCLPKKRAFNAAEIRHIRQRTRMVQPIFAVMVSVGASTVAQWEEGKKSPVAHQRGSSISSTARVSKPLRELLDGRLIYSACVEASGLISLRELALEPPNLLSRISSLEFDGDKSAWA